jgi:ATPase family associated with various cellular activities (AAA)
MSSEVNHKNSDLTLRSKLIAELRDLRLDTRRLNSSLVERLTPFRKTDGSFKTLPDSRKKKHRKRTPDISVASTCTVLMAAITGGKYEKRHKLFEAKSASEIFKQAVVKANWGSSGLEDGNAFTTAIVVRTAGLMVQAEILAAKEVQALKHAYFKKNEQVGRKTLRQIVQSKAKRGEDSFAVADYPPKSTHAYWFVDGAIGAGVSLPQSTWERIASWASKEFHRQLIYVTAENDALMDPPSLAMAACLISRIRRLSDEERELASLSRMLPSPVELQFGIDQVFAKQSESGIWHRYFPLFHFPKGGGAADYCFSFEFLEAILAEFGTFVLSNPVLLNRVNRVIRWCDTHELEFTDAAGKKYRGWSSGGEVRSLAEGKSESWATASVHMFLTQLDRKISDLLDELVLKGFGIDRRAVTDSTKKFEQMIDADLRFFGERPTTLKKVIEEEILKKAKALTPERLVREGLPVPRSVLLFGPPGTSKSRLAKALAEYLGWPLVIITPSEFLGKGVEHVHAQVDERFRDLMDLRRIVVFFDEMDALAQTREGDEQSDGRGTADLDITRQLLTTSMLPKLSSLWDQRRVIFLMATNHKQQLDPAITRPNRFDMLLCVPPPPWKSKGSSESLAGILKIPDSKKVERKLARLAPVKSRTASRLNAFTVAEVGIFLHHLRRKMNQPTVLEALERFSDRAEFARVVENWAATTITLRSQGQTIREFGKDFNESRRQYYPGEE